MTDQEITETIAEKIMGWIVCPDCEICPDKCKAIKEKKWPMPISFNPLDDDSECMAAWDKLSETTHLHLHTGFHDRKEQVMCECWFGNKEGLALSNTHSDRRRAMCECMVKAVTEAK